MGSSAASGGDAHPAPLHDVDTLVLGQLARAGADLTKARHVIHFLYFADEASASAAAAELDDAGYETTVAPPEEGIEQWAVRAEATPRRRPRTRWTRSARCSSASRPSTGASTTAGRRASRAVARRGRAATVEACSSRGSQSCRRRRTRCPAATAPILPSEPHLVLGTPLTPPFPEGFETIVVGMGCFWGAERMFWRAPGVYTTAAGYAGGITPNPTYEEVCSGRTGHTEVVLAVFDPGRARATTRC